MNEASATLAPRRRTTMITRSNAPFALSLARVGRQSALALTLFAFMGACERAPDEGPAAGQEAQPAPAAMNGVDATVHRVPIDGAPARGDAAALVTLVAFSDYQCPFCRRGDETVEALRATYGSKLRVVMRQKPLPFHDRARPAALAALAADEQGKFWEMHEQLFKNNRALGDADLARIAGEIGLDVAKWRAAMTSTAIAERLAEDSALADSLSVRGTPSFFINGRMLQGARSLDEFKKVIDEEQRKAEALVKAGVRPQDLYAKLMANAAANTANAAPPSDETCDGCDCEGKGEQANAPEDEKIEEVNVGAAPTKGPSNAPITIVIFSDFECPFCARAEATIHELEEKYPGKLRFAFRHQPLPFHENARLAARASMAAGEQGKFWEYHDALFAHQDALDRASLEKYAKDLGLDVARFRAALDADKSEAAVAADIAEASRLGISGTPTFFINGRRIIGARPLGELSARIDRLLAQ